MMRFTELNVEICTALGLDPAEVVALTFELWPNNWPHVTVTFNQKLNGEFVEVLKRYELRDLATPDPAA